MESVVVDIGANVGGFSLMLLVDGVRISKLLCVEMNPNTFERLRFNIKTNFNEVATVINAAVVGNSRQIDLTLGIGSTGALIYRGTRDKSNRHTHTVQGVSLGVFYLSVMSHRKS